MRTLDTLCWMCLLATLCLSNTTAAQDDATPPSPSDVLAGIPLFPPTQATPPGVNVLPEWEQLVQHARDIVRAEFAEERDARESARERGGAVEQHHEGGVKVVRETFYVPLEQKTEQRGPLAAAAVDQASSAAVVAAPPPVVVPEEAADIVKTAKTLRPVFTYAIHHPLRFLWRYALVPLYHLVLFLLSSALSLLSYLFLSALSPLQLVLSVVLSPLFSLYNLNVALLPLWGTLFGALLAGSGLGAIAGLVAGRTTREIIDEAIWRTKKSLIWVGVLPKEPKLGVPATKKSPPAFGPGARLETLADVFGSSRSRAQKDKKGKGKARAFSPSSADEGDSTPPGQFNTIRHSPVASYSQLPPRRPSIDLAPESDPFPARTTTSLAQRRHHEKVDPPRVPGDAVSFDPPSEELPPASVQDGAAGTRVGADGRVSGRAQAATSVKPSARGWRERNVEW
ncbi:hypothetical protein JCM6882_002864 [Rhodosporidiobolus microsporus]